MPKLLLTEHNVPQLTCPEGKSRIEYCDTEVTNLYVECRRSCTEFGTYYLRYDKATGGKGHHKLGRTTDMTLADARTLAVEWKRKIKAGVDPKQEDISPGGTSTFKVFMETKYFPYAKTRKKTWTDDLALCERRLYARFGDTPLDRITRHDIEMFHSEVKASGLSGASADHYLQLLKRVLKLAVEWEMIPKNPAASVKLFRDPNAVEAFLSEAQLQQLMAVLLKYRDSNVSLLARLLLATAARCSELLLAEWAWVDRERRIMVVPATNSKSRKKRVIPLSDSALQVLDELGTEGKFPYLFVNKATGEQLTNVRKVWNERRVEAGLPWLRLHDLRHAAASFMISSGRSLFEVQQVLGHATPAMTQRYAHLSPQALLDSANSTSAIIERSMAACSK
jgi:integrase